MQRFAIEHLHELIEADGQAGHHQLILEHKHHASLGSHAEQSGAKRKSVQEAVLDAAGDGRGKRRKHGKVVNEEAL